MTELIARNPGARQHVSRRRETISKRLRFAVLARDGFRCLYCGAEPAEAALHVDHIKPVAAGGKTVATNLATACESCNLGKSDLPYGDLVGVEDIIIPGMRRSGRRNSPRSPKPVYEPWRPTIPADLVGKRKRDMTAEERLRYWAAFKLEAPPPGYDDWYVCGSPKAGVLGAFPVVGFTDERSSGDAGRA
jgi:hypothetical protein